MNKSVDKNNLLELKNINLTIDGNKILENISLSLEKGKIKTLIGINGGGKTTLARIIIGAIKPSNGKIIKQKNIKINQNFCIKIYKLLKTLFRERHYLH